MKKISAQVTMAAVTALSITLCTVSGCRTAHAPGFGTVSYSWLEGWSLLDSLYFTLFSVLTIGFGDVVPSPENRLFTAVFLLVCATMSIACVGVVGNWVLSRIQRRSAARRARLSEDRVRRAKRLLSGSDEDSDE